jgi:endonuclease YncB( thermonuclease family)
MENRIGPAAIRRDAPLTSSPFPAQPAQPAKVLERFPAGAPRGSWPAEEFAAARRAEGIPATVVMDLTTDTFVVKAVA